MSLRIMVSRHSAFYSPLIATLAAGFLEQEGIEASYDVLPPGGRSHILIRDGLTDVMQSAVSTSWRLIEANVEPRPVHFAQVNCRDGFFLAARRPHVAFAWKQLEGCSLLADHGLQPLVMLQYAAYHNDADWTRIRVMDAGSPEQMERAFREGQGDYIHLQAPAPYRMQKDGAAFVVASVGRSMPPVAFSSLCASAAFLETDTAGAFLRAYANARQWVRQTPSSEVAVREAPFFPGVDPGALASGIAAYQELGCWDGDLAIPEDLYQQALTVFEHAGQVARRHPYREVARPLVARYHL
jgi:NitT/TauT family transport system substrate-binding protein